MSPSPVEVAVVGAGPYGLALSAHLAAAGVDHVVFGEPLVSWRRHMPAGMLLKSEPYGSDIAAPVPGHRLGEFCAARGLAYADRGRPVPLATFVAYGGWYAERLVPAVRRTPVRRLVATAGGFRLTTGSGAELQARRVVVATGLLPFVHVPALLAALPPGLRSHVWDHHDLGRFAGQRVAVVGAGQSALETAALAHEAGVEVELLARRPQLYFSDPYPPRHGLRSAVRRPASPTCEGWPCWCYHHLPDAFRAMPGPWRLEKALGFLGPAGAWWLRDRVEGRVPARTGVAVRAAAAVGARVRLELAGAGGEPGGTVEYDHVLAATGYRLDVDRLGFLDPALRAGLRRVGGAPLLDRRFESSVPGLHFVGALAAPSLGPSLRFLAGTGFAARRVTAVARRQVPAPGRAPAGRTRTRYTPAGAGTPSAAASAVAPSPSRESTGESARPAPGRNDASGACAPPSMRRSRPLARRE